MTVEQAIQHAREWQQGLTVYPGAQGWRVVCMVLADEVERLREIAKGADDGGRWYSHETMQAVARERDNARSETLHAFFNHVMEMGNSVPLGATDEQRGASVYNWYRHFADLIYDYANLIEGGE